MGGNAFPDVGSIHIDEIEPTLKYISETIKLKNTADRALGSVGKKEYSGDIDLAIEPKSKEELDKFVSDLEAVFGQTGVRKIGALLTTRVPIQNYDPKHNARQPRTGFVQVDYMFGNPAWLKLFQHSPSETESKLKGTHRNIALSTIAAFTEREESDILDDLGRPVQLIRWKWSPTQGLVKVLRTSRKNKHTGKCIKKQDEELISESIWDAEAIVNKLFRGKVGVEALNSAESIVAAVKRAFDVDEQEEIFKYMAENFSNHYDIGKREFEFPPEIEQYMIRT